MNWLTLIDPTFSDRFCTTLLHSLWQVALLALAARCVEWLWAGRSVERSYVVYVAALALAVIAVPITYPFATVASPVATFSSRASRESTLLPSPPAANRGVKNAIDVDTIKPALINDNSVDGPSSVGPRTAQWIVAAYFLGIATMLARLAIGILRAQRLAAKAELLRDGPLVDVLRSLARGWSMRIVPALARAEEIFVPKVVGIARPTILLPASAITGLSPTELEMLLAHELAHVKRYDMWVNLFQRLAEAALFFNPAVWYLSRRISAAREFCCDELVCGKISASDVESRMRYASVLLKVVELAKPSIVNQSALAASGRSPSELRRRVARLFGEPLSEPVRLSRGGILLLAAIALLIAFGPAMWRAGAQTTDNAADRADNAANTAAAKEFSFGSKVEVLAMGTHGEGKQRWWDSLGKPMQSVPFTWKEAGHVAAPENIWRRIVIRIHDFPEDASLNWTIDGASTWASGEVTLKGEQRPKGYHSRYFSVPSERKSVRLRIGVATGPWITVAGTTGNGPLATGLAGLKSIVFSEAFNTDKGTVVIVSHNYFDQAFRIIAVDKQRRTHASTWTGGTSAGAIYQSRPTFPELKRDDLDHFEFQVRDYEWLEFDNLPVNPADGHEQKRSGETRDADSAAVDEAIRSLRDQGAEVLTSDDMGPVGDPRRLSHTEYAWQVTLRDSVASDENLQKLKAFPHLKFLWLSGNTTFTDQGLAIIASLPELENVQIQSDNLTNDGIRHFRNSAKLVRLHLSGKNIDDGALIHLTKLDKLEALHLMHTNVTDGAMDRISKLPALSELSVVGTRVTDAGLANLSQMPLTSLSLNGPQITDAGMQSVAKIVTLRHLQVGSKNVTNAGLTALRNLRQMQNLQLWGTNVTDDGLKHLTDWKELQTLDFSDTPVTGAFLQSLDGEKIETLYMIGTQLDEANLKYLRGWPRLRNLAIGIHGMPGEQPDVSDACVPFLLNLPALQNLNLRSNQLSDEAVQRLKKAYPDASLYLPAKSTAGKVGANR